MQKSLIIARLIGPVLSAIGIGMLVNQPTYREMAAQFVGGLPFIYFSGILALVAGLYILNVHNAWTPDWRSAVTAVGLVPDLCRHVPDHRAAVFQLCRRRNCRQQRIFRRRRHRSARGRRLDYVQRLHGIWGQPC